MSQVHKEKGILVLDTPENMNRGKSFLWFATALELFPWATHVGKMDMDTYPFLHKLVYRMDLDRQCTSQDGPYEFIGRPDNWCGTRHCKNFTNHCSPRDCATQFTSDFETVPLGEGWHYLAGELYILSLPLVRQIAWNPHTKGNEDIRMSQAVDRAARLNHFCVVLRRPAAWYHRTLVSDAGFANDF